MKNTLTLIPLFICFTLLLGYNFMQADWSAPTATAPGDNTAAPINVSSTTQAKTGNLAANIFAATTEMRSNRYCDALGGDCVDAAGIGGSGLGVGQTWQSVNRTKDVWYKNDTGQPIMVFHKNIYDGTLVDIGISTTTYATLNFKDADSDLDNGSTFVVPSGHYYRFNTRTENHPTNTYYRILELRAP